MVELKLYYVTNRNHIGEKQWNPDGYGSGFSDDGAENLRFGKVTVQADEQQMSNYLNVETIDKGTGNGIQLSGYMEERVRSNGKISAFAEILPDGTQKLASKEMFQKAKSEMEKSTDTIVYVHGYAVKWTEAVANALSLQAMLNKKDENVENQKVIVILFTWPSYGRYVLAEDARRIFLGAYRSDRIEAEASGAALGRGILKLCDFFIDMRKTGQPACNQCIHILCHSMGNYVLQNALTTIANNTPTSALPALFEHIFLCSADVDDNVLEPDHVMGILHQLSSSVSIYYNREDKALWFSDKLKGNHDRLGINGAARPAEVHKEIHQIDCTAIIQEGIVSNEHSYYMYGKTNRDIRLSIANVNHYDLEKRERRQIGNFTNERELA